MKDNESARNEKDNKFWVKSEKSSKINPEGICSPIGLEDSALF